MSESPWGNLTLWPWKDDYLKDEELRETLDDLEAIDSEGGLNGFYDGSYDEQKLEGRRDGAVKASISGRVDSDRLEGLGELLRSRGIAYEMSIDGDDEWLGWERAWTPGMVNPFYAEGGQERVLTHYRWELMVERSSPVEVRIQRVRERLDQAIAALVANEIWLHSEEAVVWRQQTVDVNRAAVMEHRRELHRLIKQQPAPESLEELVNKFFEFNAHDWKPSRRYQPRLVIEREVVTT